MSEEDKDTNALAEQRSVNSSSPQSLLQKETVPAQESDISMQGQFDFLQQHCAVISKMATKAQEAMQEIQSLKLIMLSQTTPAASKRSGTSMCPNISPPRKKSKEDRAVNDIFQAGGSGEDSDDESISVHASENEFSEGPNDDDDPSDKLDSFDAPAPFSTENTDASDTMDPEFKDLLDSIEVNLGPKMEEDLAGVMSQIWGKSTYTDKQKKEFEKILIPKNAKFLITPLLNPELKNILYDGPYYKDKAFQRKQRLNTKAVIPVLSAMASIKGMKAGLRRTIDKHHPEKGPDKAGEVKLAKKFFKQLEAISPALRTATKFLNASYSDTLRKRKSDICHTLGKSFGGFVHSLSGEKQLFDDNTIKKMKPYIRMVAEKMQKAKNEKAFRKTRRGRGKGKAKSDKKFSKKKKGFWNNKSRDSD